MLLGRVFNAAAGVLYPSCYDQCVNWKARSIARRSPLLRRQLCCRRPAGRGVVAAAGLMLAMCLVHQAPGVARAADESVGFEEIRIGYGDEPELKGGVWFPTDAKATPHVVGSVTLNVALGAPPKGRALPLIVLSHGGGGSFDGHHDTAMALAQAGFVAAAITHAGDSYEDQSRVLELWRRPDQLARLVSYMLDRWHARDRIDARRVGAFGFSNGGFTTLVLAGGVPNLGTIERYCHDNPSHDLCTALDRAKVDIRFARSIEPGRWVHDDRIRAAVIAAPAFGFAFDKAGLQAVRIPVQLWSAADDRHQPSPHYEDLVRANLPRDPEFHRVDNAGHYDFLPPCDPSLAKVAPDICTSASGFDRNDFHRRFNAAVVAFFRRTIS